MWFAVPRPGNMLISAKPSVLEATGRIPAASFGDTLIPDSGDHTVC